MKTKNSKHGHVCLLLVLSVFATGCVVDEYFPLTVSDPLTTSSKIILLQ